MMSKIQSGARRGGGGASTVSFLLLASLALPLLVAAYTVYDNRRVVVREELVEISGLPPAFDGFTILQVSDLHGKRFGPGQERLLRTIAGLDHDAIALTGDMMENNEIDAEPLWELLAGLDGEAPVFYTSGNTGPFDFDLFTGERKPAGDALEEAGVTLLDRLTSITRGEARLWFTDMYLTHRPDCGSAAHAIRLELLRLLAADESPRRVAGLWLSRARCPARAVEIARSGRESASGRQIVAQLRPLFGSSG